MEDETKKKTRCTNKQKDAMVNYMATHSLFAHGEFTGPLGPKKHKEEWDRLKSHLNELGPAKSLISWQRTWRDLKKKARSENAQYRRDVEKTGNTITPIPIGETSQKVLGVIGVASSTGIGAPESGVESVVPSHCNTITPPPPQMVDSSPADSFTHDELEELYPEASPPPKNGYALQALHISTGSSHTRTVSAAPQASTRPGSSRTRAAPPSVATASMFASLQTETNTLLQVLIKEVKRSNILKAKHNTILMEQNLILKQTRTAKHPETNNDIDPTAIAEKENVNFKRGASPIRVEKGKLIKLTNAQIEAMLKRKGTVNVMKQEKKS